MSAIKCITFVIISFLCQLSQAQDMFIDSGQQLGKGNSWGISLIDLDGDGDLDSYFDNTMWYNDGAGRFHSSQKSIGEGDPQFGDFNGDGFIDALVMNQIYINDKKWSFTAHQNLGSGILGSVIADFDNDLDMDVITLYMKTDSLWTNDGTGHFTNTGVSFNGWAQSGYAVGDFDQDTDTDIFVTIPHNPPPPPFNPKPDFLFFNAGNNNYKKSTQHFPPITSRNVTTGDVDNDQDLDLIIGNQSSFIQLWLNNGTGQFTQSDQKLSNTSTNEFLIDLDNDNDLDAFIIRGGPMDDGKPNELWLNENGIFINSGLQLGKSNSLSAAFGDIDNDGDIDIIIGNIDLKNGGASNKVYINLTIDKNDT